MPLYYESKADPEITKRRHRAASHIHFAIALCVVVAFSLIVLLLTGFLIRV